MLLQEIILSQDQEILQSEIIQGIIFISMLLVGSFLILKRMGKGIKSPEYEVIFMFLSSIVLMEDMIKLIKFFGNTPIAKVFGYIFGIGYIIGCLYLTTRIIIRADNKVDDLLDNVINSSLEVAINVTNIASELAANVSEIIAASEEIASSTAETTSLTEGIMRTSSEINNVKELITSIADQTNLLALNASIEAGRAGEHEGLCCCSR